MDTGGEPFTRQNAGPGWTRLEPFAASGRFLGEVGLSLPVLGPEEALVVHLTAAPTPG